MSFSVYFAALKWQILLLKPVVNCSINIKKIQSLKSTVTPNLPQQHIIERTFKAQYMVPNTKVKLYLTESCYMTLSFYLFKKVIYSSQ